jgi:integrase
MPKLPRNMVKRGRSFQFRQVVNGRVVRRSLGTDYQEACRRLRSLKSDSPPLNRITVEDAAQRWLESYVPTVRSEKGQRLARQRVRDHVNPFVGHLLLSRLSAEDCRAHRLWLEKKALSIQSVKHVLSDVRCLLNWCEDSGLVDRSPFPRRILPKIQERPPDRLTDEEVGKVCSLPSPYGFVCRFLVQVGRGDPIPDFRHPKRRLGRSPDQEREGKADPTDSRASLRAPEPCRPDRAIQGRLFIRTPGAGAGRDSRIPRPSAQAQFRLSVARGRRVAGRSPRPARAQQYCDHTALRTARRGACPGRGRADSGTNGHRGGHSSIETPAVSRYHSMQRRHSQVAKATVCKTVIPGSNPGAASIPLTFSELPQSLRVSITWTYRHEPGGAGFTLNIPDYPRPSVRKVKIRSNGLRQPTIRRLADAVPMIYGLESDLIPHDMRRAAARNLVRAGVDQAVAMKLLGHRAPSMFDRYNITADDDLRDAVRKLSLASLGASRDTKTRPA